MTPAAWGWQWAGVEGALLVSQAVAAQWARYRQSPGAVECGGQLFVNLTRPDGVWLALATSPHPADRAGPTWLMLDAARCQVETAQANAQGLRLVGYWHTHPEAIPALSLADKQQFSVFAARSQAVLPAPLAVIVGQSHSPQGIRAWRYADGRYEQASWCA